MINLENQNDTQLKLYGIERIVAVLRHSEIPPEQLSNWTRKQLMTSVFQSDQAFDFSLIKHKIIRDSARTAGIGAPFLIRL